MENAGMIIDIVSGVFILLNIGIGAFRGGLREILNLVGMIAAFWSAFRFFKPFGETMSHFFQINPIAGYVLGFFLVALIIWAAFKLLSHLGTKLLQKSSVLSSANRLLGAVIGAAKGAFMVLCAGLLLVALPIPGPFAEMKEDSWTLRTITTIKPNLWVLIGKDNPLVSLFDKYEKLTDLVKDPKGFTDSIKNVIPDPDLPDSLVTSPQLEKVISHQAVKDLVSDKSFTTALKNGDTKAAMDNEKLQELLKDPEFMTFLLDEVDPEALKKELDDAAAAAEAARAEAEAAAAEIQGDDEIAAKIVSIKEVRILAAKYGPMFEYLSNEPFRKHALAHPRLAPFLSRKDVRNVLSDPKVLMDLGQNKLTPLLQNPAIRVLLRDPETEKFSIKLELVWKEWRE